MDGALPPGPAAACAAAPPAQILDLADNYANTATHLFSQKDKALGQLPARLCALHAMELYLHAFLRFRGATPGQIKARQHNLWHPEFGRCLGLDDKTCQHLRDLTDNREYVAVRYLTAPPQSHCQINRMERTLQVIRDARDRIPFSI